MTSPNTSKKAENLTDLNEALQHARTNQRRYWAMVLVWLALAVAGVVVFIRITDQFDDSSRQIKNLQSQLASAKDKLQAETDRLTGDVVAQAQLRSSLEQQVNEKMTELQKSQADFISLLTELRDLQKLAQQRLDEFSTKADQKLVLAQEQLTELKATAERQKQTNAELLQSIEASRADVQKLTIMQSELSAQLERERERKLSALDTQRTLPSGDGLSAGDQQALASANDAMKAIDAKNYPDAVASLDQAVSHAQGQVLKSNLLGLRAMVKNALSLQNSALIDVNEALTIQPDKTEFLNLRAQIYHDLDKWSEAKADLRRIIALKPDNANAWHALGHIHLKHEKDDEAKAVEEFSRALTIKPDYSDALIERAQARMLLGEHVPASADLERAMALATADADPAEIARVKEVQAVQALMRNQPDEAFVLASAAHAQRPEQLWTVLALATATQEARSAVLSERNVKRGAADEYLAQFTKLAQKNESEAVYLRRFLPDRNRTQQRK